jgi:hypothetical protein
MRRDYEVFRTLKTRGDQECPFLTQRAVTKGSAFQLQRTCAKPAPIALGQESRGVMIVSLVVDAAEKWANFSGDYNPIRFDWAQGAFEWRGTGSR